MSYQPPQDPNNPSQYGSYGGTPPPQQNPTDPYSGQQYGQQPGQQGGYQQPGYQQPGYQQPGYQQPGYQQPGFQPPPYGQQQYNYQQPGAAGATSMGLQPNVAAGLSYVLLPAPWIGGLIFFLTEKQNRFVRFHAMQSILFFGGLTVVSIIIGFLSGFIPFIGLLNTLLGIVWFVGWIILMIQGFQGKYFKLPVVGDYAEKYANSGTM